MCLLCHTAGAEDLNDATLGGGTPGVTIDAAVMFHKLHNGSYLPSLLGVATQSDGARRYDAPSVAYALAGADGLRDFSRVGWPVMPNRNAPLPREFGHSGLSPEAQAAEDRIGAGVATCEVCHGDPDGAGPLEAPLDGDLAYVQQTRAACGACHDDVDWELPYVARQQEMPAQLTDSDCFACHETTFGGPLSPTDGHRHPIFDPVLAPGLNVELMSVLEAGTNDGDGTFDPGEKVEVALRITDDMGAELGAASLGGVRATVSGPLASPQLVLDVEFPDNVLIGSQPYVVPLPMTRHYEYLGDSTPALGDEFMTDFLPARRRNSELLVSSSKSGGSTLTAAALRAGQGYVDVLDGGDFQRDDFIVIDDGGDAEFTRLQFVDGNRLWLSPDRGDVYAPGVQLDHVMGVTVEELTMVPQTINTDFGLDAATGLVTERTEFGTGAAVVLTYSTDFVWPERYLEPFNASPDLGESAGSWAGKGMVAGTYTVALRAYRDFDVVKPTETTTYREASPSATTSILVGSATTLTNYTTIPSGSCAACHQVMVFHDGTDRGFDNCRACHATAGAEDLPRYAAAGAPETPGESVTLRHLVHRIHRGAGRGTAFELIGTGPDPYPDNFLSRTYDDVVFPPAPGGTLQCSKCHGTTTTSLYPTDHDHPTEQVTPVRSWTLACAGCHGAPAALAHMDAQTAPSGAESCAICHGAGEDEDVVKVHAVR